MEIAIKVNNINKTMGKRHILKNVSFEIYKGEVFGFLGPNGAGKTTTIKMAVGMLSIDSGSIEIEGDDIEKNFEKAMSHVGAIVENPEFYKYMSGMDNLKQYARMRGNIPQKRIDEVVELVGLSNRINEKVKRYSLGMRQRLGLAQALIHNPSVIILDEPTNGLDPAGIKNLRDLLRKLAHEENVAIIVSSHLMSEMELMCDRVGIIANGEIIDVKTIEDLIASSKSNIAKYTLSVSDTVRMMDAIRSGGVNMINLDGLNIEIESQEKVVILFESENAKLVMGNIIRCLVQNGIDVYEAVAEETKTLEQIFIELTEKEGDQIA